MQGKIFSFYNNFTINWISIGVIIYFYGILLKKRIMVDSINSKSMINGWDLSLQLISDLYLIVYFIIPIFIYISIKIIINNYNFDILIRLKSYKKWYLHTLSLFWRNSIIVITIWIFVSMFIMLGLPLSFSWSSFSLSTSIYNNLLELTKFTNYPLIGLLLQISVLIFAISALHTFFSLIYLIFKNVYILLTTGTLVFFISIIGFKLFPSHVYFLSPPTYFSFVKQIHSFSLPYEGLLYLIIFVSICIILIVLLDYNLKSFLLILKTYTPQIVYLILVVLGIFSVSLSKDKIEYSILDIWIVTFSGSSNSFFNYTQYFYYCIVFFGYTYLISIFISREVDNLGYYKIIRYKNLLMWYWNLMKRYLLGIFPLLIFFFILCYIISYSLGFNNSFSFNSINNSHFEVFYHYFFNGLLQILFYVNSIFLIVWLTRQSIYGIILLSIYMLIMLPGINKYGIIPIGLNSFNNLFELSLINISMGLLSANIFVFVLMIISFKRVSNL